VADALKHLWSHCPGRGPSYRRQRSNKSAWGLGAGRQRRMVRLRTWLGPAIPPRALLVPSTAASEVGRACDAPRLAGLQAHAGPGCDSGPGSRPLR
jgi:hypothetical protein